MGTKKKGAKSAVRHPPTVVNKDLEAQTGLAWVAAFWHVQIDEKLLAYLRKEAG